MSELSSVEEVTSISSSYLRTYCDVNCSLLMTTARWRSWRVCACQGRVIVFILEPTVEICTLSMCCHASWLMAWSGMRLLFRGQFWSRLFC